MAGTIKLPELASDPTSFPSTGCELLYFVGAELRSIDSTGTVRVYSTGVSPEEVQDIVGAFFNDSTTLDVTYNDAGNTLSAEVIRSEYEVNSNPVQTINGTPVIIDFNTEFAANSDFTLNANGSVTVNFTGVVKGYYSVPADATTGTRSTSRASLFIGTTEQVKTRSYGYHRTLADGEASPSKRFRLNVTTGNVLSVQMETLDGAVLNTLANEAIFELERVF